ncbi:arylesterase [Alteromonas sp. MYP5]|uniref:Arylesterase n=1 Tax=Alteromonas ponticola TaxID=2720613 RepID=A0ABX1QYV6_9ALTE|nr:arylesterase [Alteromonas ponticola]NMH58886.1 arylesterase [Alteromonas ponticola]
MVFSDHLYAGTQNENTQKPKLLILGDSLSAAYGLKQQEGWVSLLQNIWKDESVQIDVVNAAISGETTDGGLARLPRLLEQHQPSHLLIELGGNDGLQGHPVSKMRTNLARMVDLAKQANINVLLQDMEIPTNYGRKYTSMFADSFEAVAEEHQITLIPFFLQNVATEENMMQRDGIHPNKDAQPVIAAFMNEQLKPIILRTNTAE